MTTQPRILSISDEATMTAVATALERDAVVAIPTDTVYGLAVKCDRPEAIAALFRAKRRPDDVPLPVLISGEEQAESIAVLAVSPTKLLTKHWWPGPLTVVVPDRGGLGVLLGAQGSIGLRAPDLEFVRSLCETAGPLAVTSANLHGEPPSEEATDVLATFGRDEVSLIVDGGRCAGVPSTVVDCTVTPPVCLRKGGVPWEDILGVMSSN